MFSESIYYIARYLFASVGFSYKIHLFVKWVRYLDFNTTDTAHLTDLLLSIFWRFL